MGVVESWPWFHIMDAAMQGRLYNGSMVLTPDNGSVGHHGNSHPNQNQDNQDNTDILEFLIKTEMDDTVTAETAEDDGTSQGDALPAEGVPMGWRRMSECSYKSRQTQGHSGEGWRGEWPLGAHASHFIGSSEITWRSWGGHCSLRSWGCHSSLGGDCSWGL